MTSGRLHDAALRDSVATELILESAPGGLLDGAGPLTTMARFYNQLGLPDPDRRKLRQEVIEQYLDRETGVRREGYAAIVTAGPPGAGKTTSMRTAGFTGPGWRTLDADIIKDDLLSHDYRTREFRNLTQEKGLPDGHPLYARELSSLVHRESVSILDEILHRCLREGENVIIEGTLSWPPYSRQLLRALAIESYQSVKIYDVEVTEPVAQERSLARWWLGRLDAIAGDNPLGGRFTPPAAIAEKYAGGPHSVCWEIAQKAFDSPEGREFRELVLICDDQTCDVRVEQRREHGELITAAVPASVATAPADDD